jgi:hypothetical protein
MASSANPHVIRLTIVVSVSTVTYIAKEIVDKPGSTGIHWLTIFLDCFLGLSALGGLLTVVLVVYAVIDHRRKPPPAARPPGRIEQKAGARKETTSRTYTTAEAKARINAAFADLPEEMDRAFRSQRGDPTVRGQDEPPRR